MEEQTKQPFSLFDAWYRAALKLPVTTPSAMILATASKKGFPSSRIVLLKDWDESGFVFFTNYQSRKAKELEANSAASLLFYWEALSKQVRIEGKVKRISVEQSLQYFQSRPLESQWAAWASKQSQYLESQDTLEDRYTSIKEKYPQDVPLPKFWGGYRLVPSNFEFWEDKDHRLHHRVKFERVENEWRSHLLFP